MSYRFERKSVHEKPRPSSDQGLKLLELLAKLLVLIFAAGVAIAALTVASWHGN